MSVKKYRVFCLNESIFVTGWSKTEPTTCFNNNTHSIDPNQTSLVDIEENKVRILQTYDSPTEGDSYYLYSNLHIINPNDEVIIPINLEIESNLFSVTINTKLDNIGDEWSSYINKDTPIGTVTANSTGNIVSISSTENVKPGFYITYDGINEYRVISKTDTTVTHNDNVNVSTGDVVKLTYYMVYKKKILNKGTETLGNNIIGSTKIPSTYNAGIVYKNNSNQQKKISVSVETTF